MNCDVCVRSSLAISSNQNSDFRQQSRTLFGKGLLAFHLENFYKQSRAIIENDVSMR
jgi:hypothetical protein